MSLLIAPTAAQTICRAFERYRAQFKAITHRAQRHFEQCAWTRLQHDSVARLELYKVVVDQTLVELRALLGSNLSNPAVWSEMRRHYARLIEARNDHELAETFFNSITRRIFATVGVNAEIEFVDSAFQPPSIPLHYLDQTPPICRAYRPQRRQSLTAVMAAILQEAGFQTPFHDLEGDAALAAGRIQSQIARIERLDIVNAIFYRNRGAYLVGRILHSHGITPIILALQNSQCQLYIDAVLLTENEASIVFSFTRSYFHVETERPADLIMFLKSIMPRKRLAELYIAIGYNKHGKTLMYRDLVHHLMRTDDPFEIAPGERGMVMLVFTLPSYDMVFKVIKDKFDYPKDTTREKVMACYDLVFRRDRAGRLVDAQEFEHLAFDRARFAPELLAELQNTASKSVRLTHDKVIIAHLYMERRLTPLNLYLSEVGPEAALAAALDYGQAIKDLAATNIFPGDLFLKNFGVTRHGRVVFYDYDELQLLTECNFRRIPPPRHEADELAAEPWFSVQQNDVFPEQFPNFLGLRPDLRAAFIQRHGELFDVAFWRQVQSLHRSGVAPAIYPYRQRQRLHPDLEPGPLPL